MDYININKTLLLKELKAILKKAVDNKEVYLLNDIVENKRFASKDIIRSLEGWLNDNNTSNQTKTRLLTYWNKTKDILEGRLLKLGIENKNNASLTQFTLKNIYGWKDKQELETRNLNMELTGLFSDIINNNTELVASQAVVNNPLLIPQEPVKELPPAKSTRPKKRGKYQKTIQREKEEEKLKDIISIRRRTPIQAGRRVGK